MKQFRLLSLVCLLILLGVQWVQPVAAGSVAQVSYGPYDLIAAVNALRAQYNLPPYEVEDALMVYAQAHADYMASTGLITHVRADGSRPRDLGLRENIAMGTNYSPSDVIFNLWTDQAHWDNMLAIPSGTVGAGVARSGSFIYYAMDVRPSGSGGSVPAYNPNAAQVTAPPAIQQVVTSTPNPDGSVVHPVGFGQTLWGIAVAYNIKIADILSLNQLPTNAAVYVGQNLIIRPAFTATLSPTITLTPIPPTRTPTPTRTPVPPTLTRTITPTTTLTPRPLVPTLPMAPQTRQTVGLTLIGVCFVGLVLVIFFGFRRVRS